MVSYSAPQREAMTLISSGCAFAKAADLASNSGEIFMSGAA